MINLLPPELKQQYRYGRRNTQLRRWVVMFGVSICGLAFICAGGVFYFHQSANTYDKQASITEEALKRQDQAAVEKQVTDMSSNLKLAVQVLSQEVLFSQLFKQLAVITPNNATLSTLSISDLKGAVDITARATDYNAATQLQVNLSDPANKIFSKADIVNITCSGGGSDGISSRYPCTVLIRALFTTNNPFLFINNKADKS